MSQLEEIPKSKMTITNNVKKLLDLKNVSVNQFSKDIGVTYVTAHGLYNNPARSINNELLEKLCEYFGVGPGEILVYTPNPKPKSKKD